ncbi:hypothetical protein Vadar_023179 [Vaccinium darrowii]|uniref:Uncharacterized protein n=1 Tax=Vaccinium darrowii TaxID=229202 RepID=A0ACB7XBN2_9ERIC|nr:hypothetical protein Vadar_023179 [Vaccinium darrowii]
MLMEEDDLSNKPWMLLESLAFQATEKSFDDVLGSRGEEDEIRGRSRQIDHEKRKPIIERIEVVGQSNKQLSSSAEESNNQLLMYDKVLPCPHFNARTPHYVSSMIVMPPQIGPTGNCSRIKKNQEKCPPEAEGGAVGKMATKRMWCVWLALGQHYIAAFTTNKRSALDIVRGYDQHFSVRPGGPPKFCLRGIDFPGPGFCPAEKAEEAGRRLAMYYCKRFCVPFEFIAIAKN